MSELKDAILEQLSTGRHQAIPGKLLAQRLGEKGTRQIRIAIQELIEEGIPICGSNKPPYGYYIAQTPEDCNENLELLRSYGVMLFRHYKYLKKARDKRFVGQLTMILR